MTGIKEKTPKESLATLKELLDTKIGLTFRDFKPGNLLFYQYNAKFKEQIYDKNPLVLILQHGKNHTLGLNFHWLPLKKRIELIKIIFSLNKKQIKNNKPLEFNYKQVKGLLKKLNYAPVIRLYLNSRISRNGVIIPPNKLIEVAKMNMGIFSNGVKGQIYRKIRKK